jgi:hypothetical protein
VERDAIAQSVRRYIAPGESQRAGRQVDGIDLCAGEGQRREDGETAGAAAEIEDAARLRGRQGAAGQQVADEGARDERPAVDVEPHAVHVGGLEEIGRRHAQPRSAPRSRS